MMSEAGFIQVRGAEQNNLRQLDLDLPLNRFIVVTGVSGSGKSSLAFDTLYAEGQRRYAETFSPYTRQFLERMDKPLVREIRGIPPAIAIAQANAVRTSRSTVGTMTEIADYLKLLFPAIAQLHDPDTGEIIRPWSPEQVADEIIRLHPGLQIDVLFELGFPGKTPWKEVARFIAAQGFTRILLGGALIRLDDPGTPDLKTGLSGKGKSSRLTLHVLVDRIRAEKAQRNRLAEAVTAAFEFGKGIVSLHPEKSKAPLKFARHHVSHQTGRTFTEPTPALFTFNNPVGACPVCRGFGRTIEIDYHLALPDRNLSIGEGVVKPFQTESNAPCQKDLIKACRKQKIPTDVPFCKLTRAQQDFVIHGESRPGKSAADAWENGKWYGVKGFFQWLESRTYKMHVRVLLARYRAYQTCPACLGGRFQPETLLWKVQGKTLPELNALPADKLAAFLATVTVRDESARQVLQQIRSRVNYLVDVGLDYISLNRSTRTLSGGETQRVNLTTCLGTSLHGTLFVLDEPSIGLHPRDTDRLIRVLQGLRDLGNTVLVVEHDESVMRAADWILELGPGRGRGGGALVYQGPGAQITGAKGSLTGAYLSGAKCIELPASRRPLDTCDWLAFTGASKHNLQKVDFKVPLRTFTAITGVSGSGKSTLVHEIIHKHLALALNRPVSEPGQLERLEGAKALADVLIVDQSPLTSTPRSTPLLYTGCYDAVRELFSMSPDARLAGLNASAFSFNAGTGRCPRCHGTGYEQISMQFLSDVFVLCPSCEGKRFQSHVLAVRYRGKSIADILDLTVQDALAFFDPMAEGIEGKAVTLHTRIHAALDLLRQVGLGYLTLGHPLNKLSGGESQRLKLVSHLLDSPDSRSSTAKSQRPAANSPLPKSKVIILDEPTTGLHFDDIRMLLVVLQNLVEQGHTLLVIEHHLDVIKCADYVLDLGPEAGEAGGRLVAAGTPEQIARTKGSHTGALLAPLLGNTKNGLRKARATSSKIGISQSEIKIHKSKIPPAIRVRGARHHNLKNISLDIPRDQMVVVTGLSGSGKSSLAFDLLFAEGQRRYLDCLNAYARQFVEQMEKPDVDSITGIPPAVAIEQRTTRGGAKSTVATVTEMYHFLRLLYAKLGVQHDPESGEAAIQQTPAEITTRLRALLKKGELSLVAPLVRGRKGIYTEVAEWAVKKGYPYLRADGQWVEPAKFKALDRYREHNLDVILGNIAADQTNLEARINEALDLGKGAFTVLDNSGKETLFSTARYCPESGRSFDDLDPRLFSYNSPHGWCPACHGFGTVARVHLDPSLSESEKEQEMEKAREWIDPADQQTCPDCQGSRLNPVARAVRFHGRPVPEINRLTVIEFQRFFQSIKWTAREKAIARDVLPEIEQRLAFLQQVGLDYLNLDRPAPSLSGGESQRIRLAAQLGSNLQGVLYVLDEPTIGLHPRDNEELIGMLRALQQRGNSLLIVEHDEDTMRAADHIIDLGPGAGIHGGEIMAQGTWAEITRNKASLTGKLLGERMKHPLHGKRRPAPPADQWLRVSGARAHNLRGIDLAIPQGRLTVLCGVSGAGKSTSLRRILLPAVQDTLAHPKRKSRIDRPYDNVTGADAFAKVVEVDQSPIGKTSRSTVCTYLGIMDHLRKLFAQLPMARVRGFTAGHFSYNSGPGRCPACQGQGFIKVEMNFLPAAEVPCETCRGHRWTDAVLETAYKHKSIFDVLNLGIDEAVEFFDGHPNIRTPLQLLRETGLGYLKLGQTSPTLSGGEAQRLKLVSELSESVLIDQRTRLSARSASRKPSLYLLEEPTVGLHLADVRRLLEVLHRLVEAGHTVVVIEHHLDVLAEADHLIDLGPEGGGGGGTIVAQGTPEEVAQVKASHTARYLAPVLK
ncbi:MAG: excinuclease ABC subunit UvrA [Candidatus Methylacidiphilales bacterium]|nr:excinuclease ABC subunit UvrA [Candidatus Methylacidiphilales bacterium]